MQIFLGCDVLRARSADVQFSLDRLTIFDDDRNKLSMPLVRPENARTFQTLMTTNSVPHVLRVSDVQNSKAEEQNCNRADKHELRSEPGQDFNQSQVSGEPPAESVEDSAATPVTSSSSVVGEGRKSSIGRETSEDQLSLVQTSEALINGTTPDTPTRADSGNMWTSWRRDSLPNGKSEPTSATPTSGYQRAGRGRGMKVLKPARLNTTRAISAAQPPVAFDAAPSRFSDATKRNGQGSATEGQENRSPATEWRSSSNEVKTPMQSTPLKPRPTATPVGTAFGWLNSSQQKPSISNTQ